MTAAQGGNHQLDIVLTDRAVLSLAKFGPVGSAPVVIDALARAALHLHTDRHRPGGVIDAVTSALAFTLSWIVGLDTDTPAERDWEDVVGQVRGEFTTAVRAGDQHVIRTREASDAIFLGLALEAIAAAETAATSSCRVHAVVEQRRALVSAATILAAWAAHARRDAAKTDDEEAE